MKREVVMQIADASGLGFIRHASDKDIEKFENFAALVASVEREACATIVEEIKLLPIAYSKPVVLEITNAIRAREQA